MIRLLFVLGLAGCLFAETPVESSLESRFQLDLHVPDAALASFLPHGFTPSIATQGPAKDCNLRAIFIDRLTVNTPDGKPVRQGSNRLVYLAAPVKDPSGATAQVIIGGLTEDPDDAPGPFGVYLHAATHKMQRTIELGSGPLVESQDWTFAAPTGEHLDLRIKYERGPANQSKPAEVKFYSAKTPAFFQISRQEQVLDILRNTTTNPPDRVKNFSFKAGGGAYAKLFDGTEKLLSWDDVVWIRRTVSAP
jgi:hypothetical protein